MIRLCSDLSGIIPKTVTLMNIFCLKAAFEGSVMEADIWLQTGGGEPTAVIARNGGRLYIHSDGSDPAEIRSFIEVVGYDEVFCDKRTADVLGLSVVNEFSVLSVRGMGDLQRKSSDISLKSLYDRLSLGTDGNITLPDFDTFAPDVSHRLRHGGAEVFSSENGIALMFLSGFGGILSGISVDKASRKKGEGSALLSLIKKSVDGEIFVCCDKQIKNFYIKNGFTERETAVIAR